ncbi:MFS transporter [Streptomyces albofaciens JCM 4342]|nr:MFS transporter [Streptomyces albofaciens JCM 4342]
MVGAASGGADLRPRGRGHGARRMSTGADVAATRPAPPPRPLSRNREYNLLWSANMVSQLGAQGTLIAYPMLVLALGGSALQASLVEFAIGTSRALAAVPAGALADRWNRRTVLLVAELGRAVALGLLALTVALGSGGFGAILAVAVVEGVCTSLFTTTDQALLPGVVPRSQLGTAVARNTARYHLATVVGPGLGGVLYGVHRLLPFVAQAAASLLSFVTLLFLRVPRRPSGGPEAREGMAGGMRSGLRWLAANRPVRTTVLVATVFNLAFGGMLLVVVVMAQQAGRPAGEIGAIGALLGAGGVVGAVLAPRLRHLLTPYAALMLLTWGAAVLVPLLAVVPLGYASGLVLAGVALLAPTASAIVTTYQMLVTPDGMRGRLAGVIGISMSAGSALGPLIGGVLLETAGGTATVLVCTAVFGVLALVVSFAPAVRTFPRPKELEAAE